MRTIQDIDQPILWIVPFAGFTLIVLISLVNIFLHFLPSSSGYYLMLFSCAFVGATVSGFITELIRGKGKYVYVAMGAAVILSSMAFLLGYGFFKSNVLTSANPAEIPIFSGLISKITLTMLPGIFTGAIIGGGLVMIPDDNIINMESTETEFSGVNPESISGYEKICRRCDTIMPFDSLFCSRCGGSLKKRRVDDMKFCRYCGNKLHFHGEFCPDCGKEIRIISKPKVFVSD